MIKHYNSSNWIYCVSLILDPRFKYQGFDTTKWGKNLSDRSIEKFEEMYKNEYDVEPPPQQCSHASTSSEEEDFFDAVYVKENVTNWHSEITAYIKMPRAHKKTKILEWWRDHENVFPKLAKMARDVFSTLASSAPVERFFSGGALIMTDRRNRLDDIMLKICMCTYSWMKCGMNSKICGGIS